MVGGGELTISFVLSHTNLCFFFRSLHVPQSLIAKVELQELMHVNTLLISAANNCNSMGIVSKVNPHPLYVSPTFAAVYPKVPLDQIPKQGVCVLLKLK